MHSLFSFPILVEPDIQRLSGFLLEALRRLNGPIFSVSAKIPALNQHLREACLETGEALEVSLILEKGRLQIQWPLGSFSLAFGILQPDAPALEQIRQDFKDKIHTSNPELLRLQNTKIRDTLEKTQKDAQKEICEIENQLRNRKKELDIYMEKAETDSLTGIYNRRAYDRILHEILKELSHIPKPFSLIFLDLDYFKEVNDTFGHAYGDEVLCSIARAMRTAIRGGQDSACRIGGDEFAILFSAGSHPAERISKIILASMNQKVSIGIATWQKNDTPKSLAHRADRALYHAKENGRGQVALASPVDEKSTLTCHICL